MSIWTYLPIPPPPPTIFSHWSSRPRRQRAGPATAEKITTSLSLSCCRFRAVRVAASREALGNVCHAHTLQGRVSARDVVVRAPGRISTSTSGLDPERATTIAQLDTREIRRGVTPGQLSKRRLALESWEAVLINSGSADKQCPLLDFSRSPCDTFTGLPSRSPRFSGPSSSGP